MTLMGMDMPLKSVQSLIASSYRCDDSYRKAALQQEKDYDGQDYILNFLFDYDYVEGEEVRRFER